MLLLLRFLDLVVGVISREPRLARARQSPELTAHMDPKFLEAGWDSGPLMSYPVQMQRTEVTAGCSAVSGLQQE